MRDAAASERGPALARAEAMVIPQRDWLLLRGRMRAAAKISDLPLLLMARGGGEGDDRHKEAVDSSEKARDT